MIFNELAPAGKRYIRRRARMSYRMLANAVVVFHFMVVLFVIAGALLLLWRRWVAWVHLPVIAWVIFAEIFHHICPLTFLENWLRDLGGDEAYAGDFVDHYIIPVLYPRGLTATMQVVFGIFVLVVNVVLYAIAFRHKQPVGSKVSATPVSKPA
jgi:hypothetical protein